jgi:hypothetical protein
MMPGKGGFHQASPERRAYAQRRVILSEAKNPSSRSRLFLKGVETDSSPSAQKDRTVTKRKRSCYHLTVSNGAFDGRAPENY